MAWDNSTRRSRLPADWGPRRRHVLERDGHRCTILDEHGNRCPNSTATGHDIQVDHIVQGDDHSYPNLAAICDPHHKIKTAAEAAAGRRRNSPRRPPEPHPGMV